VFSRVRSKQSSCQKAHSSACLDSVYTLRVWQSMCTKGSHTIITYLVLAGSCVWMVSSPSYPDYDGFQIYLTENATAMPQPTPSNTVAQQAVINGQNAQFRNFDAALSCVLRRNQQQPANGSWPYVDGWDTTLSIIR